MTQQQHYYYGTGRRKTAVARVRLYSERGPVVVNGKHMEEMFPWKSWQDEITEPFRVTGALGQFRVVAKVSGGGIVGQAGALRHGISRALLEADPNLRPGPQASGAADPRCPRKGEQEVRPQACPQSRAVDQTLNRPPPYWWDGRGAC